MPFWANPQSYSRIGLPLLMALCCLLLPYKVMATINQVQPITAETQANTKEAQLATWFKRYLAHKERLGHLQGAAALQPALQKSLQKEQKTIQQGFVTMAKAHPTWAAPWYYQGLIAFDAMQYPQAAKCLNTALLKLEATPVSEKLVNPAYEEVLNALGTVYWMQKNYPEAKSKFTQVMKLHTGNPVYAYNLGTLHQLEGNFEEAIVQYQEAIKRDDTYQKAWFNLGVCYQEQKRLEEAKAAFRQCMNLGIETLVGLEAIARLEHMK